MAVARPMSRRSTGFKGALVLLAGAALLHLLTFAENVAAPTFAMLAPSEAAPQVSPEMSKYRVGDRVRAQFPIKISNDGRGYYNEGAGLGIPDHQRDVDEDQEELDGLLKVIEGGNEGVVIGILPKGEWANRPPHWKGQPRAGVMVSWDEAELPIEVVEEADLEQLEGSVSAMHIQQRKLKWKGIKY
eukprot:TRINITY_DN9357_c0_g1_i1.p1 TRINITY_DN9357_c0_g1~~TRINITY_DN9357_c0_g1_i1.p1  ORF type:complete len:187 (-),score=47.14 TRINITY_DN9357_c0_g1_i1:94-654(-)